MKRFYFCVVLICLAFGWGIVGYGQNTVAPGTPAFGSFDGGPDILNLGNLNVHWNFPILTKAGRGTPFVYNIPYDSTIWTPVTTTGSPVWTPPYTGGFGWPVFANNSAVPAGGAGYGTVSTQVIYMPCIQEPNPPYVYVTITTYKNWSYTDGAGTNHPFIGIETNSVSPTCPNYGSGNAMTNGTDSNGDTIHVTNYTTASVTSKAGITYNFGSYYCGDPVGGTSTDGNGNETSWACGVYTDTLV